MTPTSFTDPVPVSAHVSRISHLSLKTPRLEAMVAHYTTFLGLSQVGGSGSTVHLACSDGTPALELSPAGDASLDHLGFDLGGGATLDEAVRALESAGITPQDWTGTTPAGADAVRLTDPDGSVIALMERKERYSATTAPHLGQGVQPFKLGHVASRVDDLSGVVDFYRRALGFRFSDAIGDDFVFMRCNSDHHSVNFLRTGTARQVHHVAFQLQDWAHVKTAADELWSHGVPLIWGPGRHGAGHNIYTYHHDPDGNIVELFTELDQMSDESTGVFDWRPWHDGPQRPRTWDPRDAGSNPWGLLPPDKFLF